MREILFRGKRVDNGEWVQGSLVNNIFFRADTNSAIPYIINPDEYEDYDCMDDIGELAVEVILETVGQFTGLLDKNGKKIFEGDILCDGKVGNGVVTYFDSVACFMAVHDGHEVWDLNEGDPTRSTQLQYTKVIGNIHDNPELLS